MAETKVKVAQVDPVWTHVCEEARAAVRDEPLLGGFFHQIPHLIANLSALGNPMLDSFRIELKRNVLTGSDRVIKSYALNIAAITRLPLIGHNNVIKRTPFSATTR